MKEALAGMDETDWLTLVVLLLVIANIMLAVIIGYLVSHNDNEITRIEIIPEEK